MKDTINTCILNSMKLNELLLNDSNIHSTLINIVDLIVNSYKKSNKVLLCGNGGSAADAQHFSTELTVRLKKNRKALAAISLSTDTSAITAIGNDYNFNFFDVIFGIGDNFFYLILSPKYKIIILNNMVIYS